MIGAIEAAMVARAEAASADGALGYALKTVASYGNELDGDIRALVRAFPAVWIVFEGENQPREIGQGIWRHEALFAAIVAQRNRRNEEAARRGAGGKAGAYQMVEDMRALLSGQTLGLAIDPLMPGRVRNIHNGVFDGEAMAIYGVEFRAVYETTDAPEDAKLDSFEHFHADWDLPPHGNVTPPLPAAEADATDDVNLEGDPD